MKRLLLIDGNAILHRAYHAYPSLTNPKGEVVQAVYGFFSMLITVLQDQKPQYLVICFDRGKPTIRMSMFAGYHAHRPKATDDFISQIILVHTLLEKMKVAVFELDGFEGDDLIGTIATKVVQFQKTQNTRSVRKSDKSVDQKVRISDTSDSLNFRNSEFSESSENIEVIILTGDRDMLQLVNGRVKVLMPLIGITKTVLFDEAAVEAKYGVRAGQFVDYKALIGDASDGYPGVSGIGPKTASGLLQKYETFENLYAHAGELPEKIGMKLAMDAEQAALAKKLAAIITDVPIQFDIEKCKYSDFDIGALRQGFEEQGFKSLLARLDTVFGSAVKDSVVGKDKKKKKEKPDQLELL